MDLLNNLPVMLTYDPETGVLTWKTLPVRLFKNTQYQRAWNTNFAGKQAFVTLHNAGYLKSTIRGKGYLAHRVIWALQTGAWPKGEIDHINGNRADNRWCNLRVVTRQENMRNQARSSRNKTGVIGIFWVAENKRWRAYISGADGSRILGHFRTKSEAIAARKAAEERLGYHANHGRVA